LPTAIQAAILGVIQGLTEFLPVSSTAHLLITERLLGYHDPGGGFTVMIQLGSILAMMWVYRSMLLDVAAGLRSRPEARRFALMLLVAFLPAVFAGAFLADFVQTVLYESVRVYAWSFILGGVAMLVVERIRPQPATFEAANTPLGRALAIGLCQVLALVPGVSRSGATIVGGLLVGLDRRAAAEFSFFLAMPTLAAAFVYSLANVSGELAPSQAAEIAIGFVMAFVAAAVVVKPFLAVVSRKGFAPFAWYRIGFGALLLAAVAAGWA
jgi:undecaprenyl-diphosphatase